ncbi:phosphotransferase system enzyme I (PtsI) [Mucilaginibacter frigoritolerans]|uniref:Phosphoenolpyruvate-protein phosphotransferase n=1 Tax=Mucilaginibacter frigoritolerans TaxID=652788 RepID=A0A562TYN2_9SPHI|nr:phosphoenolpyruvate--protein phosphotransferase [Mucilaginibacter frigoritolerans]TWI98657.1 phosphotransferase system enzyme I (PtsI) [Mucilaginibacter frigoritolerans]
MNGIGVSPGISLGIARILKTNSATLTGILLNDEAAILAHIKHFDDAVISAVSEVNDLIKQHTNADGIEILETQVEFLSDPQLRDDVVEQISIHKKNVNDALIASIAQTVQTFESMYDEFMRARAADIKDIGNRILKHLNNAPSDHITPYGPDTIVIAEDISPSDTITMDLKHVIGIATQVGSKTSHAAIIAKSKGLPAVVGCGNELAIIKDGDFIILDGSTGMVLVNPDQQTILDYTQKRSDFAENISLLKQLKDVEPITTDGTAIILSGNISNADDLDDVFDYGGQGVGLMRTELLFMNRNSFPTENEQFDFYKKTALKAKGKPVIVRTIDIGGDKQLAYFNLPVEENPFLGYRAIRICLDRTDLFITQLKAILRASIFGDLKIMFPMIASIQEVRQAKTILQQAKEELAQAGQAFNDAIEIGIMIEIPSAAITADLLATEVDFFSIGTNDLCQYTLAVDRMNEKISHLYDPFNPGVLRLIDNVISQANKNNIHVGMCGELASDPLATLLLMGMGLKDFSMSASSIPAIKQIIINNNLSKAKEIYNAVLAMDNSADILNYLQHTI